MDLGILAEIVGGVLAGLLLGPFIYTLAGFVSYMITEKNVEARKDNERREHTRTIAKQKKRYERANIRYMKTKMKVEKFIVRKSTDEASSKKEPEGQ